MRADNVTGFRIFEDWTMCTSKFESYDALFMWNVLLEFMDFSDRFFHRAFFKPKKLP